MRAEQLGICCNPDTIIQDDDLILFIGRRSTPIRDTAMAVMCDEYTAEATRRVAGMSTDSRKITKTYKNVLLAGWRQAWDKTPLRFRDRLNEAFHALLPNSLLTLINFVAVEDFQELIEKIGGVRVVSEEDLAALVARTGHTPIEGEVLYNAMAPFDEIVIRHVIGDASEDRYLQPIIFGQTITTG
jgi:hypothetical protein